MGSPPYLHPRRRLECRLGGTIIISTATVLVCFGYVQRVAVGMYVLLRVIDLETAVGYEDTAAATAGYSLPACNHRGGAGSG